MPLVPLRLLLWRTPSNAAAASAAPPIFLSARLAAFTADFLPRSLTLNVLRRRPQSLSFCSLKSLKEAQNARAEIPKDLGKCGFEGQIRN